MSRRQHTPHCANIDGVSLHANVSVPARDRRRLERLCRYAARPPLATGRLSRLDDGGLLYKLKRRWRDGTSHVVFQPVELVEKLAAITPPPRFHMVRYHGLLAPRAGGRAQVVRRGSKTPSQPIPGRTTREKRVDVRRQQACRAKRQLARPLLGADRRADTQHLSRSAGHAGATRTPANRFAGEPHPEQRWIPWAELMRRVFAIDVLECARCGGPMRVLAAIVSPKIAQKILESLRLPTRGPPTAGAVALHDEPLF